MKIAFFTDTYLPQLNGVAVYLGDAITELTKKHQVILFAPGHGPLKVEKKSENFKIYWIPSSPFPFYDGYRVASMDYRQISNILKTEMPDVVHSHAPINLGLQGLLAAKRKKIPTIVTYHTHFPEYIPHLLKGTLPKIFDNVSQTAVKKMIKYVFRKVDRVAAPTEELVNELRSYGLSNVTYLPNGIDFSKLKSTPKEIREFVQKNNIPEDKKIILYLGRISFEKKLDQLLAAFKKIEQKDRILLVVGGGPYLKNFKQMAVDLEITNVIFTGFVKNESVSAAYQCSDIFVSASDTETFGLTFVEAMYFGLPAIGVRKLGAKEVILHEKTGILVDPGDVDALAKAMDSLLENGSSRDKMSKQARKRACLYSIENSVKDTLNLYRQVIAQKHQKPEKSKGLNIKIA